MRLAAVACVLLCGCAARKTQYVGEGGFADQTAVEFSASFDEVYDATWMSLEKLGFTIVGHDRRQGTLSAAPTSLTGDGFQVQATTRETRVRLEVWPRRFSKGGVTFEDIEWVLNGSTEKEQQVASLHAQVKALLDAWKAPLELDYLKVGHALLADGMRLPLPASWNVLELRVDRRHFKLQALKRAAQGANPTLVAEVDRRRPLPSTQPLAQEAADLAVPDVKAVVPDDAERQPLLLGGGLAAQTQTFVIQSEPFDLDAFTFTAETHAWALRAAAVCPRAATVENAPDAACVAAVKGAFAAARRAPRE